jgi:hypothetical protein
MTSRCSSLPLRLNGRASDTASVLRTTLTIALFLLFLPFCSQAEEQRWEGVDRVVAFGDVHGASDALLELLTFLDIIDAKHNWSGGQTHLVSLGDLLDRGPDSRAAMDLLIKLQAQAQAAGGRVHVVLGNHELMNLTGDLRYISADEYAAFTADETQQMRDAGFAQLQNAGIEYDETQYPAGFFAHRAAFTAEGRYGSWLLQQPAIVVVNDSAFVHGGFPDWMNQYSLGSINEQVGNDLQRLLELGTERVAAAEIPAWRDLLDSTISNEDDEELRWLQQSPFLTSKGPFWYRGNASCHRQIEAGVIERALENFGVKRLVMGHSPTTTRRIQQRFAGKVILADTGMLHSYYRGQPSALIQDSSGLRFAYADSEEITDVILPPYSDQRTQLELSQWQAFLNELEYQPDDTGSVQTVTFKGQQYQPVFTPANRRDNESKVAAFLLDQALGMGMVPPTIERSIRGRSGTLSLLPTEVINEAQRVADNVYRPNYCANSNDYQLMYIFDALSRNTSRSQETMLYDRRNMALVLTLSERAFATATSFPEYLAAVPKSIPGPLAARLAELDEAALQKILGDLLSSRQIRAIDRRRQYLLENWRIDP